MINVLIIRQIRPDRGIMGSNIEPYDIVTNRNDKTMDWLSTNKNNGWTITNDRVYTSFYMELSST